MFDDTHDVSVVGAGLSGLTTALRLHEAGRSVVVLEARDRVGGRTLNESLGDGKVVELGGQWVGPSHTAIRALAAELGIDTFPTHIAGEHLFDFGGRTSRYRGDIPRLAPFGLVDFRVAQARLERMARTIDPEAPARARCAKRRDSETAASWIARNMRTRMGRELMRLAIEAVLAVDPADLSLLHWLFYIRVGGGLDSLVRTDGGYQQDRFVGGSQEIAIRVARRLGERVRLAVPVTRIEQQRSQVELVAGDQRVRARFAVLALPPALTSAIAFDPPLPGVRQQLAQRMPQGTVAKYMAVYPEPFWRPQGLSGHATADRGPVTVVFDNSPPDGSPGVLLAFSLAGDARRLAQRPERDRREAVLARLTELIGARAAEPARFIERAWAEEEWTRGCYAGYFGPGGWTAFGDVLRRPVGRLHWAGAETATLHHGSMDGAVAAGERAAAEVLGRLGERPTVSIPQTRATTA
ncbi:MAG TPA: flavin monoamine oxidase family protein [Solirubrobacteraceae bacterium]